jgi:hypothetical protein
MRILMIGAATAALSAPASAQDTGGLVAALQANGFVSIAQIRDMRGRQFAALDKDGSGGLSPDEAEGALSIAGGRRPGGAGPGAAGGRGGGGAGGMAGGMSDEQRARMREMMRQRMANGEGRRGQQGGAMGKGGGAMGASGQNPLGRMQFVSADADFDGSLSKAEFVEAPVPMLVGLDKDMDGRLTVEEIQAAPGRGGGGGDMQPN